MTDRSGPPAPVPVRLCVGCRRRDSWSALLRVVAVKEEPGDTVRGAVVLVPDPRHRLPGRGAWLHPTEPCLEQAVRRTAFGRALRLQSRPDLTAVTDFVRHHRSTPTPDQPSTEGGFADMNAR